MDFFGIWAPDEFANVFQILMRKNCFPQSRWQRVFCTDAKPRSLGHSLTLAKNWIKPVSASWLKEKMVTERIQTQCHSKRQ